MLFIDGTEVSRSAWNEVGTQRDTPNRFVTYGKVYATSQQTISPGEETTIWGNVTTTQTSDWTDIVEVPEAVIGKTSQLGCGVLAVGGSQHPVPVGMLNVTDRPVQILSSTRTRPSRSFRNRMLPLGRSPLTTPPKDSVTEAEIGVNLSPDQRREMEQSLRRYNAQLQFSITFFSTIQPHKCVAVKTHSDSMETGSKGRYRKTTLAGYHSPVDVALRGPICPLTKKDGGLRLCVE